jgi:hypothetical protein
VFSAPTQKDKQTPSSRLRLDPHFQTHKRSWNEHKLVHGSRRDSNQERLTCLAVCLPLLNASLSMCAENVIRIPFAQIRIVR